MGRIALRGNLASPNHVPVKSLPHVGDKVEQTEMPCRGVESIMSEIPTVRWACERTALEVVLPELVTIVRPPRLLWYLEHAAECKRKAQEAPRKTLRYIDSFQLSNAQLSLSADSKVQHDFSR